MCDFNTPKAAAHLQHAFKTPITEYYTPRSEMSDSEESTNSCGDYVPSNGGRELSLVAEYDEIVRLLKTQRNDEVEDAFLDFTRQAEDMAKQLKIAAQECHRLQQQLDLKIHESSDLESKLNHARKMIDQEKRYSRKVEDERDYLEEQISRVKEFLHRDGRLGEDARQKLSFLNTVAAPCWDPNSSHQGQRLSAINEVNTTGSLLSDFSYSKSEDDLDVSALHAGKGWKKHRPSMDQLPEPAQKKRRSSNNKVVEITNADSIRATTTLTVPKHGPITATSIIQTIPNQKEKDNVDSGNLWKTNPIIHNNNLRQHVLQSKTIVMPDTCVSCEKRLRFGKSALKCKDCRATCHPECKGNLPLPCVPYVNTPTQKNILGFISDYTPTTTPMVPALIMHCLNEIEQKGLMEIGLYRIPGSERDVKQLKEKFLRGKGSPCLNQVDVHVICGTVKDFLRSLQEPLITLNLWHDFVRSVEQEQENIASSLYQVISELPQPNRDTLAYMILHLKRIGDSKECKMPISNLSKIFGPTIVGYSSSDPDPELLLKETRQQNMVMEHLMNLPTDYWAAFINNNNEYLRTPKLQQTPSTDSLLRPSSKAMFTPNFVRSNTKRKQKQFFQTPPNYKN
ncbi:PREDICTED: rac GTPase-activating protein 1-like [Nicrophorus vespilloides]|uniref:Rac GTPase-activating protein 1-like n=1 Tax=Nicrophorus vespilloides TaxID=110193 RepID=A0ABM1MAS5_NICVS|nr:PREDICTED: rac GTPase-activating protein 1-like [Nicrophorus vespilloides]